MPFLNLETGVLLYADTNVENPKIRLADITDSFQQIAISNVKSAEIVVGVGETKTLVSTQRTLPGGLALASCDVLRPIDNEDVIRIATSSLPNAFRTARSTGVNGTTHLSLTRVGPRSMKLMSTAGNNLDTTSVVVGDQLWIERNSDAFTNVFSTYNCDKLLTIQSKGSNYVVVNDEGMMSEEADLNLATQYASAFRILAKPTVDTPKVDDWVKINGNFNHYNKGVFRLLRVTDSYIEFANPYAVTETVTPSVSGITVFDYFIRFLHMVASGELDINLDGNAAVLTTSPLDIDKSQFTATIKATDISVTNNTMTPVVLRCQSAGTAAGE